MKILITGGLGFLGGRLGKYLSEKGHAIVIGTRRNLNPPDWLPTARMALIDWGDDNSLNYACLGVDLVIHTAGMNAKECELNPVAALDFNGIATSKIIEASIRSGVKKFIYLSTAHVYSNPLQGLIDENTIPTNKHPYATSHLAGEIHVRKANEKGLINSTVLRLSNAYGAPTTPDVNCWMLLVNDLCMQANLFKQLKLSTPGVIQRNFITLSDVCSVISTLINTAEHQALPPTINIGNRFSNTIHEMALLIQERCTTVLGFNPKILINSVSTGHTNDSLDYQSLYIDIFEKSITNNRNYEIDNLLNFCKKFFDHNGPNIKV